MKTYEKLAVLGDDAGEPRYVERTYFYDYKKRLMQVVERNPEGGISRTSYDYDLVGNVVRYKELRQPYAGADEDMVTASYVYDNRRRLIREVRALNYENSVAVDYEYDDLGKLVGKTTRNGGLNTTMAYNLQGWQTDMQVTDSGSPLFDTHLRYYDPQYGETTPSYAGNISEWTWRQGGESDENTYAFTYDSHSRLTDTDQYINGEFDNQFVEDYMSYDYNGNIKFLKRYEHGILKNYYVYRYNGNQLTALDDLSASSPATSSWITPASSAALGDPDPTPDPAVPVIPRDTIYSGVGYVYDSAGNVLYDSHTGLNLRYNDLNLIEKVMHGDTIVAKYSYLSDGTKFSATDSSGNGLYYSGSLIYTKHGAALTMESCAFTGGRFVATATGVEARYFVTDHLGSVRAVVNGDGEVLERNDYYPFGSRWDDGLLSDNRYRYNGNEAQAFLNNPYLDYGARQYDSDGAVWLGTDQLSELYYHIGSYAYCANNPINAIDADGRLIIFVGGFEPNRSVTSAIIGTMMLSNSLPSQMKAAMMASAAPNRDFSKKDYYDWGSVNELYIDTYNDQNALYTQGRTTLPGGSASKRYNMGLEAGRKLVQQILAGEVELTDDETIKLVGHSQGAAYAAGIAQALIDAGYQDRIGFVDYIAAHQPSGFSHPQGVLGRQF
ncbi:RHS repeat-associated core domain-containing protein, partial [Alistipes sp.]